MLLFQSQFVDDTPELYSLVTSQNRAQKVLAYLGDLVVNGSSIKGQMGEPGLREEIPIPPLPHPEDPERLIDCSQPCTTGWRSIFVKEGPEAFAKAIRNYKGCLIMDTTWRDAHQSLFATRLRTIDILKIAKETSHALANAYSLECWGGATFDVALRFLYEDPWERLRLMRKLVPNICFQALIRGANGVGFVLPFSLRLKFALRNFSDRLCIDTHHTQITPSTSSQRKRWKMVLTYVCVFLDSLNCRF